MAMKTNKMIIWAIVLIATGCSTSRKPINLSGKWDFTIDTACWNTSIVLPGSMTSNGLGDDITLNTPWTGSINDRSFFTAESYAPYRAQGNIKVPFWLQPVKYYKGEAWYRKRVQIPQGWDDKALILNLERAHWETRLWVDGREVGMQNGLATPHRYDLTGILTPGIHTLVLCIDNRVKDIDPGENSHSISDHTQGNWNGVVGNISIEVHPLVYIGSLKVCPDATSGNIEVEACIINRTNDNQDRTFTVCCNGAKKVVATPLAKGDNRVKVLLVSAHRVKLWDEFNPSLYKLTACLSCKDGGEKDYTTKRVGFRSLRAQEDTLSINGRALFLRGTLDCAAFPLTGYPPTDVKSWRHIYKICKSYGLNHVRYHSWCPPEAAFAAADELGMYLEIECSSWANQSTTIGDGKPVDKFVLEESERIVREYGNHPSFCMMSYGNEPGGKHHVEFLKNFVTYWKNKDGRRLYCTAAGWPNLPENDYLSSPQPRIQRWGEGLKSIINSQPPCSNYDWNTFTSKFNQPVVSHEIGQWCVYPNFKEMKKYTGVLRPKNFEIFKERLKSNGLEELADSFLLASGKLQTLCYKADIEASLRTKGFGGFQLLGLTDFPGQGTALVGTLDAFWESKGYVTASNYRRFCNDVVPLARLKKMIFTNDEYLNADFEVANYSAKVMKSCTPRWRVKDERGKTLFAGNLPVSTIPLGNCHSLGSIHLPLETIATPQRLDLELSLGAYSNDWHVWVYPAKGSPIDSGRVLLTDTLDEKVLDKLKQGGMVLLSLRKGSLSPQAGGSIPIGFSSIFWNTSWTRGQAPHTLGILCNPRHPALALFPTDYYCDYQWWDAMSHSGAIEYAKISSKLSPIVRVIDDWFTARPLGLVFEMKVGEGRLLLTSIDMWSDMEHRHETRQLLRSLYHYMTSKDFHPSVSVNETNLHLLFLTQKTKIESIF